MRTKRLAAIGGPFIGFMLMAGTASAGTITTPSANPFPVPTDGSGTPVSFTISASGYTPGGSVFVEQCDGASPADPSYSPAANCDSGTSPAAATPDANGVVTFPAGDLNFGFTPVQGLLPSGQFACVDQIPAGQVEGYTPDTGPTAGVPNWDNCTIRTATNANFSTADQAYLRITFASTPTPSNSLEAPLVAGGVAALAGGAFVLIRKRRAAAAAAA